jgi:hypothetical protein
MSNWKNYHGVNYIKGVCSINNKKQFSFFIFNFIFIAHLISFVQISKLLRAVSCIFQYSQREIKTNYKWPTLGSKIRFCLKHLMIIFHNFNPKIYTVHIHIWYAKCSFDFSKMFKIHNRFRFPQFLSKCRIKAEKPIFF